MRTNICTVCKAPFVRSSKSPKQKTCGKTCGYIARKSSSLAAKYAQSSQSVLDLNTLPPPEMLPASYVKRVADLWNSLVSDGDVPTRIA